jgi:hypothetical protein
MERVVHTIVGLNIVFTGTAFLVAPRAAQFMLALQASGVAAVIGAIVAVKLQLQFTDWLVSKGGRSSGGHDGAGMGVYLLVGGGGGAVAAFVGLIGGFATSFYALNKIFLE